MRGKQYYIASCVFTAQFSEISMKIQDYVKKRFDMDIVRCCVPKYKITEFEQRMPEGCARQRWSSLPDSGVFLEDDIVYSLCHNCNNIIEEMHSGVEVHSLWELIDMDQEFTYPDYSGMHVTIQDCWRAKDRKKEQEAVRNLLQKMGITFVEARRHHADTDFCGKSLYREQPPRNPKLAPKHYVDGAKGLFIPHSASEQDETMRSYCSQFETDIVVCYCHYCLEGLTAGGVDGRHIAHMLFESLV